VEFKNEVEGPFHIPYGRITPKYALPAVIYLPTVLSVGCGGVRHTE